MTYTSKIRFWFCIQLLPTLLLLSLAGCASKAGVDKEVTKIFKPTVPGGVYLESYKATVTIIGINPATRQITLRAEDGSTSQFRATPDLVGFESHQMGDTLKIMIVRELATHLEDAPPQNAPAVAETLRSKPGIAPGMLVADVVHMTATLLTANPSKHEATMRLSDGRTAVFTVRPDIDLTQAVPGTKVAIRTAAAAGILSE